MIKRRLVAISAALVLGMGVFIIGRLTTSTPRLASSPAAALRPTTTTGPNQVQSSPSTTQTVAIIVAQELNRCEFAHGLNNSTETAHGSTGNTTTYEGCQWPPTAATEADGYWQVVESGQQGPETSESSDADWTTILTPSCQHVQITPQFGSQGTYQNFPPIVLSRGTVTSTDSLGSPWKGPAPYPYPQSSQIDIISNMNWGFSFVKCVP